VRVVTTRAYHALFVHNMLIRPTPAELAAFGEPDALILNAGEDDSDGTSVDLSLARREICIRG
jgi:phosphoenolpyruvate carboxykinase (ATP)